jgi:hypothetical protein
MRHSGRFTLNHFIAPQQLNCHLSYSTDQNDVNDIDLVAEDGKRRRYNQHNGSLNFVDCPHSVISACHF